jgi:hypothetical protein
MTMKSIASKYINKPLENNKPKKVEYSVSFNTSFILDRETPNSIKM